MTVSKIKTIAKQTSNNGVRSARLYKSTARSRVTNGTALLPNVDGRTFWVRRYRDINALLLSDQGGEEHVSESVKMMCRRASCLAVELERRETLMAEAGEASDNELEVYQRSSNTLRRLLQALSPSLERKMCDTVPSLDAYLMEKQRAREQAEADDAEVIDADAAS